MPSKLLEGVMIAAVLLFSGPIAGQEGIVVLVGDVPAPAGLAGPPPALPGLVPPKARHAEDLSAAVAEFEAGASLYWERGNAVAAAARLTAARAKLSGAVPAEHRAVVLRHLWLLAMLLQHDKKQSDADAVLDHTLQVDPAAVPSIDEHPVEVTAAHARRRKAYLEAARRITVRIDGQPSSDKCTALIDGVVRGPLDRALGPFPPGEHAVGVSCDAKRSWVRTASLRQSDLEVLIPAFELELVPDGGALRLTAPEWGEALEAYLQARSGAPWILSVAAAPQGRVTGRLLRPNRAVQISGPMAPEASSPWLHSALAQGERAVQALRRPAWWHWTLIGAGAALIAGGAAAHVQGTAALRETESGDADRRGELGAAEAGYGALYTAGGAALVTGAILAIIGAPQDAPAAVLLGPTGVSAVVRF